MENVSIFGYDLLPIVRKISEIIGDTTEYYEGMSPYMKFTVQCLPAYLNNSDEYKICLQKTCEYTNDNDIERDFDQCINWDKFEPEFYPYKDILKYMPYLFGNIIIPNMSDYIHYIYQFI